MHAAVGPNGAELRRPILRPGYRGAHAGFDTSAIVGMHVLNEHGDAPVRFGDWVAIAETLVMTQRAPRGIGDEIQIPIADQARLQSQVERRSCFPERFLADLAQ